jgi:hypothetical protein
MIFGALGHLALGQVDHPQSSTPIISVNILNLLGEITVDFFDDAEMAFLKSLNGTIYIFSSNSLTLAPIAILDARTSMLYNLSGNIFQLSPFIGKISSLSDNVGGVSNIFSRNSTITGKLEK